MSTPAATGKRERSDTAANHVRIIAAARAVFAEQGFDVEMREIAERAGVAVGTLYRHFTNRDDLLRAVLDEAFEDMTVRLRATASLDDPRAALRAFLHTAGAIHEKFKSLFMVMHDSRFSKLCADKGWSKRATGELITGIVVELVTRGIQEGVFRADLDAEVMAGALMGSMLTFELLASKRPYPAIADALADLYLTPLTTDSRG